MAPRPDLEKQYMSSTAGSKPSKAAIEPRPSASILLLNHKNEVLLLHRVRTSSAFPSAHVFPGGNVSASQDGEILPPTDPKRHVDSDVYRCAAIRECFEESGILLAKKSNGEGDMLDVDVEEREAGRKEVHDGRMKFGDWVKQRGGVLDTDALIPFTRWVTPTHIPKRFTTQMYVYFLPLSTSASSISPIPTHDGGLEHTAASFAPVSTWLSQATSNEIILFPPQFYLMHLLSPFLSSSTESISEQRREIRYFLETDLSGGNNIPWGEKVMSPTGLFMRKSDGRSVLALDQPGPELSGSGRAGDSRRIVLVKFSKEGPRNVEVREREEVLAEEEEGKGEAKL